MLNENIKIILVEDDVIIAESLKILLENYGYEIIAICYTYQSAIIAMDENPFDLLLTDLNLGFGIENRSGFQIAQYCNEYFNKPIIFLTAYSDKSTISKCNTTHPYGYLVKPVNENTLFATIQLALENYTNKTNLENANNVDYLFIKVGNKNIKIFWKDVYYIEALKNSVKLHTVDDQNNLFINSTLVNFTNNILPMSISNDFIKINRSELLRKSIIIKFNKNSITTIYGEFEISEDINL